MTSARSKNGLLKTPECRKKPASNTENIFIVALSSDYLREENIFTQKKIKQSIFR